jgi:hypothetical protein
MADVAKTDASFDAIMQSSIARTILEPNKDPYHLEQWKGSLVVQIGLDGNGVASHHIGTGKAPIEPDITALPPVPIKPTKDILEEYIEQFKLPKKATLISVLLGHYADAVRDYEEAKQKFERAQAHYDKYKSENMGSYPRVVSRMSDQSMAKCRNDAEGLAAIEASNAMGLVQAAIKTHSLVDSKAKEMARESSKNDVERIKQKEGEAIDVFLHRYESALKQLARIDPRVTYEDVDKRGHIRGGLNQDWTKWKDTNDATGTMPTTFAALCEALRHQESMRAIAKRRDTDVRAGAPPSEEKSAYVTEARTDGDAKKDKQSAIAETHRSLLMSL